MKRTYKIGGRIVEINSIYEKVHDLCKDYVWKGIVDFNVEILQSDIDFEREKAALEDKKEDIPTRNFSDGYLETLAVYRKIAEQMIEYNTILFHGSAIAVDGIGYLFTAKSGTGKSTHTRLWREHFGERAVMVNDDKPLIQVNENEMLVHGTSWDGKHHLSSNISVPLKAICILNRGAENKICRITKSAAYPMLLQQTHRPANAEKMQKVFTLLDLICEKLPIYKLECNMNPDVVTTAYIGMNTEE